MSIFDAIQLSCTHAGLPKAIVQEACALYKNLEEAQKVRGETRRAMMGASVFVTCRNHGVPRSHEEIATLQRQRDWYYKSWQEVERAFDRHKKGLPPLRDNYR